MARLRGTLGAKAVTPQTTINIWTPLKRRINVRFGSPTRTVDATQVLNLRAVTVAADGRRTHNACPRDAPEPLARLILAILDKMIRLSIDPIIVCTA